MNELFGRDCEDDRQPIEHVWRARCEPHFGNWEKQVVVFVMINNRTITLCCETFKGLFKCQSRFRHF